MVVGGKERGVVERKGKGEGVERKGVEEGRVVEGKERVVVEGKGEGKGVEEKEKGVEVEVAVVVVVVVEVVVEEKGMGKWVEG